MTYIKFKLLIVLIIFSLPLSADFSGLVIKVIDGDTIIVLDGAKKRKVRLVGIDAPELKQNFGLKSKQELSGLIDRKRVKILSILKIGIKGHLVRSFIIILILI